MNNNILKMFVPQLLKQAENPDLKTKLIKLINDKKEQTLEEYIRDEYGEDQEDIREDFDCVLVAATTKNELIIRVMVQDKTTGEMVGNCGIYRYEDILEAIKKALK